MSRKKSRTSNNLSPAQIIENTRYQNNEGSLGEEQNKSLDEKKKSKSAKGNFLKDAKNYNSVSRQENINQSKLRTIEDNDEENNTEKEEDNCTEIEENESFSLSFDKGRYILYSSKPRSLTSSINDLNTFDEDFSTNLINDPFQFYEYTKTSCKEDISSLELEYEFKDVDDEVDNQFLKGLDVRYPVGFSLGSKRLKRPFENDETNGIFCTNKKSMTDEEEREFLMISLATYDYDWEKIKMYASLNDDIIKEFRRFLILKAILRDTDGTWISPSSILEKVWCLLLLFPIDYMKLCEVLIPRDADMRIFDYSPLEQNNFDVKHEKYNNCLHYYKIYFKEEPPQEIWPSIISITNVTPQQTEKDILILKFRKGETDDIFSVKRETKILKLLFKYSDLHEKPISAFRFLHKNIDLVLSSSETTIGALNLEDDPVIIVQESDLY
jgi:hypothetical protein